MQTVLGYQSVMEAFGRISFLRASSSRCSHLVIWTLPSPSYLSVLRCLGVACGVRHILTHALLGSTVDILFTGGFGRISLFSTCGELRSEAFSLHSYRMDKCAQLMLRVAVCLRAVRTLNLDNISTSSPWWRCRAFSTHFASFFALLRLSRS